jgi:monoamine oxidase
MGRFAKAAYGAAGPGIAVVGAGLAGLTCAYRLQRAGYYATVYEAHPDRIGGRCWTIRSFSDGQLAEHGGELIDQGHTALRQLAQELGFTLDNLLQGEPKGTEDFFYVNGAKYPYSQLVVDLNGIYQKLHKDVSAASYPTLWNSYTQRGWELDHMSIIDWLDKTVPNGGSKSNLGRVLDIAYNIEYGAECSEQSALNLLYLLGYRGQGSSVCSARRTRSTTCEAATTRCRRSSADAWPDSSSSITFSGRSSSRATVRSLSPSKTVRALGRPRSTTSSSRSRSRCFAPSTTPRQGSSRSR